MHIETLAIHAGRGVDAATAAVTTPIHLSTTFERNADQSQPQDYDYIRRSNPNRNALETCLAALEGGSAAAAFASGSAATQTVLQALRPEDHVVAARDTYMGTTHILRDIFEAWGGRVTWVDMTDLKALEAALIPQTRLVWVETPSNPMLRITDLQAVAERAHAVDALVCCDNTWATPLGQRPFEWGVDLIVHSTTKYLGGHSDVLGGAVITREQSELWGRIRSLQEVAGAVAAPFDCWLVLRGIQTFPYRVRAQTEHALKLATWLYEHPAVQAVYYPGLPDHAGYAIAARQMCLWGGMISIQVVGDQARALDVAARVRLWTRATSLGGPESLIEHRASIEGADTTTPTNLLRLSVGLEHPDDLIADLEQALETL